MDATCDLPSSIIERHDVHVLPNVLGSKDDTFLDTRDKDSSLEYYNKITPKKLNNTHLKLLDKADIVKAFKDTLLYHSDQLVIIAPHLKLSDSLNNFRQAIMEIQPDIEKLRRAASLKHAYKIRVIESNSGLAGYGLTLYEALRLSGEKARSGDQLKKPLDAFKQKIETHVMPGTITMNSDNIEKSPFKLNWVTEKKLQISQSTPVFTINEFGIHQDGHVKTANSTNEFLEKVYDSLTRTHLENHLVNVSYAGNLANLRVLPTFRALHEHIKSKGGKMVHSIMSPTYGVQLGLGALSVAFSASN